jgi:hypothetical protein
METVDGDVTLDVTRFVSVSVIQDYFFLNLSR